MPSWKGLGPRPCLGFEAHTAKLLTVQLVELRDRQSLACGSWTRIIPCFPLAQAVVGPTPLCLSLFLAVVQHV